MIDWAFSKRNAAKTSSPSQVISTCNFPSSLGSLQDITMVQAFFLDRRRIFSHRWLIGYFPDKSHMRNLYANKNKSVIFFQKKMR